MGKKTQGIWARNGLSIAYLGLFLICLGIQSCTGWHAFNQGQVEHGEEIVAYAVYLASPHFWQAVGENWESEFLQMATYVFFTVFLFQKGSSESKDPEEKEDVDSEPDPRHPPKDAPWPVQAGGVLLGVYKHSLTIAFVVLFLLSFALHAFAGVRKYNAEEVAHGGIEASVWEYVATAEFWFESMQNWQSEFLAVFSMVALSVYLRQKGSPESKPVAAPHASTGN